MERRAAVARRMERVRAMAASRLPAGLARELDALASDRSLAAEAWIEAAEAIALRRRSRERHLPVEGRGHVSVLVVFSPDPPLPDRASATPS